MKCLKLAWDTAFNKDHDIAGWRIKGMMIPFTRHALWKRVEEDEVNSASKIGSLPSSNPSPTVIAVLDSNATLQTPSGLLRTHPLDPSAPSPALRIKSIPDAHPQGHRLHALLRSGSLRDLGQGITCDAEYQSG